MINDSFLSQIKKYNPNTVLDIKNAMKEVLQDIILSGLAKSDFFKKAIFYGGTSLRIFRDLPRFSEDLDFTLIANDIEFDFDNYLLVSKKEIDSLNIECDIYNKEKKVDTTVQSRFFRFNLKSLFEMTFPEYVNQIINNELLTIKVEVERSVISGGLTETKLLTYPSFAQIKTFNMETLFASKLIAVLNRKWKSRIKGRDYYDYLFYISKEIKPNILFLENGLKKFGYLNENEQYSINRLKNDLKNRFENIDFDDAITDVMPFVSKEDHFISSFNKHIFVATVDLIS
ncbi:MAG: nucleotidyl transferase AbiEii/AbiGii toxin family protein [Acholeplasmatales bacterium]|nr:nucleotidyl transferase AbiEii/AbiGii toxin family protein [Acholeplasmatales bacterium]